MLTLGIETSCDETAAAVVEEGDKLRSNIICSQNELHRDYGGVVPELAGRKHLENILPVIKEALKKAGIGFKDLDLIAVTVGPGLMGALLIGLMTAKGIAYSLNKPLIGVNHLEGHLLSIFLTDSYPAFPFLSLLISGGHTNLYRVNALGEYKLLGRTRDDALGESFDKVARMIGLDYPGGPLLEKKAKEGNPAAITFPRAYLRDSLDFSFSGMKTAVRYFWDKKLSPASGPAKENDPVRETLRANVAAGFQQAVIEVLIYKLIKASKKENLKQVVLGGGVAANQTLRRALQKMALQEKMQFYFPPSLLCTDNAAMIASAGYYNYLKLKKKGYKFDKKYLFRLEADPNLEL